MNLPSAETSAIPIGACSNASRKRSSASRSRAKASGVVSTVAAILSIHRQKRPVTKVLRSKSDPLRLFDNCLSTPYTGRHMQADRFTVKSHEAVAEAQRIAARNRNSEVGAQHLLLALLEQEDGFAP